MYQYTNVVLNVLPRIKYGIIRSLCKNGNMAYPIYRAICGLKVIFKMKIIKMNF